jgi:hypothetical protein
LRQQSEVASQSIIALKEAVFWMDDISGLIEFKVSRSKWLFLDMYAIVEPLRLEAYTRALRPRNQIVFVNFYNVDSDRNYALVAELIRDCPSVTSIRVSESHRLPAIQRDTPLFINDSNGSHKIEAFLHDNQSQLARTRHTHVFIDTGDTYPTTYPAMLELSRGSKIAVSFFGPPSGNLILKLTHSSAPATLKLTPSSASTTLNLQDSHRLHTFEYPVPSSLTSLDITLFPSPSDHPSFVPNARNSLIIEVTEGGWWCYVIHDIRLQDEARNDYGAACLET